MLSHRLVSDECENLIALEKNSVKCRTGIYNCNRPRSFCVKLLGFHPQQAYYFCFGTYLDQDDRILEAISNRQRNTATLNISLYRTQAFKNSSKWQDKMKTNFSS